MSETTQRGRGGTVIGMILIGLGIVFLLGQVFQISFWQFTWPFFIIVPGLMFFIAMIMAGKPGGPLAIPGSIVTTVGVLLLFQSLTNMWHTWAYAWSLIFPTSIGIGMIIGGRWSDSPSMVANGRRVMTIGIIIFLLLGALFELVLNINHNPVAPFVWPALMIGIGIWLLLRRTSASRISDGNGRLEVAPPRPPAPPTPPRPPAAPTPTQFEPIDKARGKRKTETKKSPSGEPEMK